MADETLRSPEQWNNWYARPDPWGTSGGIDDQVRTAALMHRLSHARFMRGLDLGCGEGRLTNELSSLCASIVGFDISETAVARARERYPHIEFRAGDLLDVIKLPDVVATPFDFICVAETLYYLQTDEERAAAVAGLARLGASGCLFFVSVIVNSTSRYRRYFSHDEIVALLSRHFVVIDSFPCLADESTAFRIAHSKLLPRTLQAKLTALLTVLQAPESAKHTGYFALKRGA